MDGEEINIKYNQNKDVTIDVLLKLVVEEKRVLKLKFVASYVGEY